MQKKIKRRVTLLIASMMVLLCVGCSDNTEVDKNETNNNTSINEGTNDNGISGGTPVVSGDSKVLIAYFSNTGNTHKLSQMIETETGADVFRIVPKEAYGKDVFERAQDELNDGTRPELESLLDKEVMVQYDTILVGFPIWWYDLPMPVWTFLEEYNLSGKTIIPYFTHNGSSGGAGSLDTIEELCPDSTVRTDDVLSISGRDVEDSEDEVKEWISGLGL